MVNTKANLCCKYICNTILPTKLIHSNHFKYLKKDGKLQYLFCYPPFSLNLGYIQIYEHLIYDHNKTVWQQTPTLVEINARSIIFNVQSLTLNNIQYQQSKLPFMYT